MKINKIFKKIIVIIVIIVSWYLIVTVFNVSSYIFPDPIKVFRAFSKNNQLISENAFITVVEALLGFLLANLISIIIALLISFYKRIENMVMLLAIIIKTMPAIAIAPLLIIWFGSGISSKIVIAMLVCFFPTLVNVLRGVKSLDVNLLWLFKVYSASRLQTIKKLIFPSILPYLFSAFKTSSSLAVVGALVGEFIGSNRGLGFLIISNYYNMNTPLVFAAIIISSIIGISFYYIIHFFEKRLIFDEERMRQGYSIREISAKA